MPLFQLFFLDPDLDQGDFHQVLDAWSTLWVQIQHLFNEGLELLGVFERDSLKFALLDLRCEG